MLTFVNLHFTCIVNPYYSESNSSFRFGEFFEKSSFFILRMLFNNRL